MPEIYFNNFATTVATGGYTAASGVLNVLSTTGITLSAGETARLSIYRVVGSVNTLIVILIATAVNSGTQFAVTAEGADANALATDNVINTLTVGGMNQIRSDISGVGTFADLPTLNLLAGMRYKTTDGPYEFVYNGSQWLPFIEGILGAIPSTFTFVNQGSATQTTSAGYINLATPGDGGGTNLRVLTQAQPSTPYTLDTILSIPNIQPGSNLTMGIGFRDSGSGKLSTLHIFYSGSPAIWQVNNWNSPTSYNTSPFSGQQGAIASAGTFFARLTNDGTTLGFWVGDGLTWYEVYSVAVGSFITPTDLCFFIDWEGSSGVTLGFNLVSWRPH